MYTRFDPQVQKYTLCWLRSRALLGAFYGGRAALWGVGIRRFYWGVCVYLSGGGGGESEMAERGEYGNTDTASVVSRCLTPEFPRKLLGNFVDKYRNILQ